MYQFILISTYCMKDTGIHHQFCIRFLAFISVYCVHNNFTLKKIDIVYWIPNHMLSNILKTQKQKFNIMLHN